MAPGAANRESADATAGRQLLLMLRIPPSHFQAGDIYGGGYQTAPGRAARRRLARTLAYAHGARLRDDWPMPALGLDCFVLEASSAQARTQLLRQLAADPRVESVQPMQTFRLLGTGGPERQRGVGAGDPLAAAQPAMADWHLRDLHRLATGRHVVVAALDTGVDAAHPDLRGQRMQTRNFVDGSRYTAETHGTEVAGIIAAGTDDGVGIAGIAPGVRLLALRACWQLVQGGAACSSFSLAKALQFALQAKAQVVNLSLTGPSDPLLARLLDVALQRDVAVIAAFDLQAVDGGFPAAHPGVFAVAGLQPQRPLPMGTLLAADRGIPAPRPGGGWELVSGTSFAAAQVSGLVALLRQLAPRLDAARLRAALMPPAISAHPSTPAAQVPPAQSLLATAPTGLGLPTRRLQSIDACAAVGRVAGRCACDCVMAQTARSMPRQ